MPKTYLRGHALSTWSRFVADLREWWVAMDRPTAADVERRLRGTPFHRSTTVLADALAKNPRTKPTWPGVEAWLVGCGEPRDQVQHWKTKYDDAAAEAEGQTGATTNQGPAGVLWNPRTPERRQPFVGRTDDLEWVVSRLRSADEPVALHGLPGVGKTQLAAQAAFASASHFDTIWWADGRSTAAVERSLAELGRRLDPPIPGQNDADRAAATVHWLRRSTRWLVIADSISRVAVLDALRPAAGRGAVLATTTTWDEPVGWASRHVWPLGPQESARLLAEHLPGTEGLAAELGGFPLLLHQVGAFLRASRMDPTEYMQQFQQDLQAQLDLATTPDDHRRSIGAAWAMTFRYSNQKDAGATRLFEALCFGAVDAPIPFDLVLRPTELGSSREMSNQQSDNYPTYWPRDVNSAALAMMHLQQLALVAPGREGNSIHGLVASVVRQRLSHSGLAKERSSQYLAQLGRVLPTDSDTRHHQRRWGVALPHVVAATGRFSKDDPTAARDRVWLLDRAATYHKGVGRANDADAPFTAAHELAHRHLSETHWLLPVVTGNLNLNNSDRGSSAEPVLAAFASLAATYQAALKGRTTLHDRGRDVSAALIEAELADTYQNQGLIGLRYGSHALAVDGLRKALDLYLRLWPAASEQPDHPALAKLWLTLGWAATDLHDWRAGKRASVHAHALVTAGPLADGYEETVALNNLAMSSRTADPDAAKGLMRRVLRHRRVLFGLEHASTFSARVNLALVGVDVAAKTRDEGALRVAIDRLIVLEGVLEPVAQGWNENHVKLLRGLGQAHRHLGHLLDEPAQLGGRARTISTSSRAVSAHAKRTYERAETFSASALELSASCLPADHPVVMVGRLELSKTLTALRASASAKVHLDAAVPESWSRLDQCAAAHPLAIEVLRFRSRVRKATGDADGAAVDQSSAKAMERQIADHGSAVPLAPHHDGLR